MALPDRKMRLIIRQSAGCAVASIKDAPFDGNIAKEVRRLSATLAIAHALASRRLLPTVQNQKCLQFVHWMILF